MVARAVHRQIAQLARESTRTESAGERHNTSTAGVIAKVPAHTCFFVGRALMVMLPRRESWIEEYGMTSEGKAVSASWWPSSLRFLRVSLAD